MRFIVALRWLALPLALSARDRAISLFFPADIFCLLGAIPGRSRSTLELDPRTRRRYALAALRSPYVCAESRFCMLSLDCGTCCKLPRLRGRATMLPRSRGLTGPILASRARADTVSARLCSHKGRSRSHTWVVDGEGSVCKQRSESNAMEQDAKLVHCDCTKHKWPPRLTSNTPNCEATYSTQVNYILAVQCNRTLENSTRSGQVAATVTPGAGQCAPVRLLAKM